ncbi:MAG TPA: dUTP diphosphatase [Candidatus Dojkabacteria bacterium]|nr:dUTP diphosphatase [Candidatus Dojkabacteria bacterium]
MIKISLKKTIEEVEIPSFGSELSSGFDVKAMRILKVFKGDTEVIGERFEKIQKAFEEKGSIKLRAFERVLFDTGLQVADIEHKIADTMIELQVRSRSGIALKQGLIVANQPGTIDEDYRGTIGVILMNSTPFLSEIKRGERIAQIVPGYVPAYRIDFTEEVTETERGNKGFGSSGKK